MNSHIEKLKTVTEPLRQEILNHKVYDAISHLDDLKIFMQYHVYAVWDFMSLLKSLQNSLTCISVPWFPVGDADTRHLINEIVLGEESDTDITGNKKSHFEQYIDAMQECGANTAQIETFISELKKGAELSAAYEIANTPAAAREFVDFTFDTIRSNKVYLNSAIFTFGREDLIPGMFYSIVSDLDQKFPGSISIFKYYLERHIEVDGDHHSHLALQMTANLCGTDEQLWLEAEQATLKSLQKRIDLWDGAYQEITHNKIMKKGFMTVL